MWADSSFVRDNVLDFRRISDQNLDFTLVLTAPRNGIRCTATVTLDESEDSESEGVYTQPQIISVALAPVVCVGGQIFSRSMDKVYKDRAQKKEVIVPNTVRGLCDQVYHNRQLERIVLTR